MPCSLAARLLFHERPLASPLRTLCRYNAIVPTFLDLPGSFMLFWGAAPIDLLGVALYYSSIQSGCGYCTLHCCYFALARGVPRTCILAPQDVNLLPPQERIVAKVAVGLASVPAKLSMEDREALRDHFSARDCEHIVLAVCMMGYLNKMMDCTGIDMEEPMVTECNELLTSTGEWSIGKFAVARPDGPLQARPLGDGALKQPRGSVVVLLRGSERGASAWHTLARPKCMQLAACCWRDMHQFRAVSLAHTHTHVCVSTSAGHPHHACSRAQAAARDGLRADTWKHRICMVPLFPALAWHEMRTLSSTPATWPKIGQWLQDRVGHRFPVLAHLHSDRARRSIATGLDINLNPARRENNIPSPLKHLAGVLCSEAASLQAHAMHAISRPALVAVATRTHDFIRPRVATRVMVTSASHFYSGDSCLTSTLSLQVWCSQRVFGTRPLQLCSARWRWPMACHQRRWRRCCRRRATR